MWIDAVAFESGRVSGLSNMFPPSPIRNFLKTIWNPFQ